MPTSRAMEDRLKSVPLFQGLSRKELGHIANGVREERFLEGDAIVREGDPAGRFYVIAEGRASLIQDGKRPRRLPPGAFFGEMSLLDSEPRSMTIVADTPVNVFSISSTNFMALLQENWSITRKILAELSRRVREANRARMD